MKPSKIFLMAGFVAFASALVLNVAKAAEKRAVADVVKIDMNGATATVELHDAKADQKIVVLVEDKLTLDKFKDGIIKPKDEIRLKYEEKGGKNISKFFRKTAGCN